MKCSIQFNQIETVSDITKDCKKWGNSPCHNTSRLDVRAYFANATKQTKKPVLCYKIKRISNYNL